MKRWLCLTAGAVVLALSGVAGSAHSPSLDLTHYRADDGYLTFVVNTDRARFTADAPASALEIWVANRFSENWAFDAAAFRLAGAGATASPVDHKAIYKLHSGYASDKRWLARREKPTAGLLESLRPAATNFYPVPDETQCYPFYTPNVDLPHHTIAKDVLFFEGAALRADGIYTLSVTLTGKDEKGDAREKILSVTFPLTHSK